MEHYDLIPLAIVALLFTVKFAVIIAVVLWSKSNQKKKKQLFLEEQERLKKLRASNPETN